MSNELFSGSISSENKTTASVGLKTILFSFGGRVNRSVFWSVFLSLLIILVVVVFIAVGLGEGNAPEALLILLIPLCIIFFWISLANQVKRWHDLDLSGWMVLINLVPFVGGLISLICLGCLKGTNGSNSYGQGPLSL
jgi:uncharacterized membrane protein YhaH (DUF805 family)